MRQIIHPYESFFDGKIQTYRLEEIIAEKMRALLQFSKKLHERGWGRSRARDYYDLWCILRERKDHLNYACIPLLVKEKCANKDLVFETYEDLFSEKLMVDLKRSWIQWVKPLTQDLPDLDIVKAELRSELKILFEGNRLAP